MSWMSEFVSQLDVCPLGCTRLHDSHHSSEESETTRPRKGLKVGTHTLAWSKVIFLCCAGTLEHSPLRNQVIQHHLILRIILSFSAVLLTVCVGGGGGAEGERERVVYRKVWVFFFFSHTFLFHVMVLVLRRRNGTEKNTLLFLVWMHASLQSTGSVSSSSIR